MISKATDLCCPTGFSSIPLCCWTLPAFRRPFDNVALIVYLATSEMFFAMKKIVRRCYLPLSFGRAGGLENYPPFKTNSSRLLPTINFPGFCCLFVVCFKEGTRLQISKKNHKEMLMSYNAHFKTRNSITSNVGFPGQVPVICGRPHVGKKVKGTWVAKESINCCIQNSPLRDSGTLQLT